MKCSMQLGVLMKLAVLGACAGSGKAALAQSSLTLYGLADSYIEYRNGMRPAAGDSASGGSALRMNSGGLSGSRWGLRGVEDLGGGMQAVFALESGFYMHTGAMGEAGRPFNRQAFLGLNGPYGMLTLGRQYISMFDLLPAFMPLTYAGSYEPMPFLMGNLRLDNSVKYRIESGPLAAQAHYQLDDAGGERYQRSAWGGGASYLSGPFGLAAVYDQAGGAAAAASSRLRKLALAATYAPDPWRLTAGYRWAQDKTAQGRLNQRDDMWWIGLGYRISPVLRITAAFYYDDVKARAGARNPPNARQHTLQLVYGGLSKRTDLYAAAAYARNSGLNFAPLSTLPADSDSQAGVALGIRHKF